MKDDYHYVNLDEIITLNKKFDVNNIEYSNNNKEYLHLKYDNKDLFINFKGIIYNIELIPRKKIFIKVDQYTFNNYLELLLMISKNIGINIKEYDSTYLNVDNHYLLAFLSGFKKNNDNIIYTNFKSLNVNQLEEIKIIDNKLLYENDFIESFEGIITLKIKTICKDLYRGITYKLFNDIHQIVITKKIIKKENNNVDNILKLINK
jgi:hypothetical protein